MPKNVVGLTALSPAQQAFLVTVPSKYRTIVARAFAGDSRAIAVKGKCLDCSPFVRERGPEPHRDAVSLAGLKRVQRWQRVPVV